MKLTASAPDPLSDSDGDEGNSPPCPRPPVVSR
jgi:hypothetical protein